MTIEGVRADMDTAQRRFELEKLFVPLKVLATPPEFPASDPEREQKLQKWHEKNKDPVSFGRAFTKHKHLALLALPRRRQVTAIETSCCGICRPRSP